MVEPNPTSPEPLRLGLLQTARLGGQERLERKIAAVLAYLALEGATPRSKIAGLLWPESPESTARNNLAQALRRLKQASGTELISGSDVLSLQHLYTDVAELELAYFAGHHQTVIQTEGQLLGSYDYDDCPDFDDWLIAKSEYLSDLRRKSLMALAEAEEKNHNYREALNWVERLLEADPLSEMAHRQAMRLWYLLGDRAAALQVYHRCQEVLHKELGIDPLPETQALAKQIDQGQLLGQTVATSRWEIPLNLLRPPQLVGREAIWAQLEEAYQQNQVVFLRGEPGVGKTRLATDFAASKGRVIMRSARPGDASVPFSSHARRLRETFTERPELVDQLPQWVRLELSRILPELSQHPPPMASEADTIRFYDALSQLALFSPREEKPSIQVSDDAQYLDRASVEAMVYQFNKFGGVGREGQPPFTIQIYRRSEIAPEIERDIFMPLVEQGLAVLIDLESLELSAVEQLIESLEVEGLSALTQNLSRYTGGNPFFLLETARSLLESGNLHGKPQKLPTSGKVRALIQRRLERLSLPAFNLAQTAAVAAGDFSLELAVQVLQTSSFALSQPIAELEAAQILKGNTFIHDLLYEATLDSIPASIKGYLHRQIAMYLQSQQAEPARIAGHWIEGGDAGKAAPLLLEAAGQLRCAYRLSEAAQTYIYAGQTLEALNSPLAFGAYRMAAETLLRFDTGSRHQGVLERLHALASNSLQKAQAALAEASLNGELYFAQPCEAAARRGLQHLEHLDEPALKARLLTTLGQALWLQYRSEEALEVLQQAVFLSSHLASKAEAALIQGYLGIVYSQLDRQAEAIQSYHASQIGLEAIEDRIGAVRAMLNRAVSLHFMGDARQGIIVGAEALGQLEQLQGVSSLQLRSYNNQALRHWVLDQYQNALDNLDRALAITPPHWDWARAYNQQLRGQVLLSLGAVEQANELLQAALSTEGLPQNQRLDCLFNLARLEAWQDSPSGPWLEQAKTVLGQGGPKRAGAELNLLKARFDPSQTLRLGQQVLEMAQLKQLPCFELEALLLLAQCLAQKQPKKALKHMQKVNQLAQLYSGMVPLQAEIYLVQIGLYQGEAQRQLIEKAMGWLEQVMQQQVPPAYRTSFLERNPTNRAIVEAARFSARGLWFSTPVQ